MSSPKLLVVGGTGMLGLRCARAALGRGLNQVVSASRSGQPHAPQKWHQSVQWLPYGARDIPDEVLSGCSGVISTPGVMVDSSFPAGLRQLYLDAKPWMNPAGQLYKEVNCDLHLDLADRLSQLSPGCGFVYISAHPASPLNRKLPLVSEYFASKSQAEQRLGECTGLRISILRPTVMYSDEDKHTLPAASVSRIGGLMDQALAAAGVPQGTVPHFVPGPPVYVDKVAQCAVEAAINPEVSGVLGLEQIKQLAEEAGARHTNDV